MPGLQVRSPVRARARGNKLMFLFHMDVSLPLSLPPFPSLSMSSGEAKKNNKVQPSLDLPGRAFVKGVHLNFAKRSILSLQVKQN